METASLCIELRLAENTLTSDPGYQSGITPLVKKAQNGDRIAFGQIYHEHVGRVYAVCLRILADTHRAEELTQDVFVRAWDMIGSFRGESAFTTWLHRLAVNAVLNEIRTERRRTARVTGSNDLSSFDTGEKVSPPGTAIDLEHAIGKLPPQARTIFVLHDIEGYQHEEIAQQMGLASGTTKAQLHRARILLREMLQ